MGDRNPETDDPFFSALVTPHRSLPRSGFRAVMIVAGAVCLSSGLVFWSMGAWPVAGFFGLDIAALWLAFKLSYRSGRAYEEVKVSHHEVHVRKVSPSGRIEDYRFNPLWIRLSVTRLEDEGCVKVSLVGRGIDLVLGGFLNPDDRESFANAFSRALHAARSGPLQPA